VEANLDALRVLATLDTQNRHATPQEQATLARWSGWGATPAVFDDDNDRYAAARQELRQLVGQSGFDAARRTTLNAHYTDPDTDRAMWSILTSLGFQGGTVLEPGCGAGTFLGTAPVPITATGVELDPTTARIAAELYPNAQIRNESFVDSNLPLDSFDAVIGNVPFSNVKPHDPRFNQQGFALHDYFIYKSVNQMHPGATAALLTSRWTMDKTNPAARRAINEMADLVTAIRLPTGAMGRSAGTDALVDLLVLRRRKPDSRPASTDWEFAPAMSLVGPDGQMQDHSVNQWFHDHPELILGRPHVAMGMGGHPQVIVDPDRDLQDLPDQIRNAAHTSVDQALQAGRGWTPADPSAPTRTAGRIAAPDTPFQEGHLRERPDGTFEELRQGAWNDVAVPRTQAAETRALLDMRDQAVALLHTEAQSMDNTPDLDQARTRLRQSWQNYVDRWGPIGRVTKTQTRRLDSEGNPITVRRLPPAVTRFRKDPHGPLVMALEVVDEEAGTAKPGPLLRERMITPRQPVTGVDTVADAVAVSLDTYGRLDLDYMSDLLGASGAEEVAAQLRHDQRAFQMPGSNQWIPAEDYLSGQVRSKLDDALAAAAEDPDRWTRNVEALQAVMPQDLTPAEIEPRLGAVWIPDTDYTAFLREITGDHNARVAHAGTTWSVDCRTYGVQQTEVWGTDRMPAGKILQAALLQKPLVVMDPPVDGHDTRKVNPVETEAANAKLEAMQARFAEWVWEDPRRTDRLCTDYNRRFNSLVLRDFSEAGQHLSLPGLAANFTPRPHQRAAVARILSDSSTGLFHAVGAGKTAEMVMGVTELKRLGLIHKPMVVVPNHMLEQMSREWLQLYPQAKILAAGAKEASLGNRRDLVARAATGDWDAIIMSTSAFTKISVTPTCEQEYRRRETDDLRAALENLYKNQEGHLSRAATRVVKKIEKRVAANEERVKALADSPHDPGLSFEDLGVDHLTVDEFHEYKNLHTDSNISDANIAGSKRATDLHMKLGYLRQRYGRRVLIAATATPVANSVSEIYNMTRYIAPELLQQAGITAFDQWAATFGEQVAEIEISVAGQLKPKTRLARFTNVPELSMMLHQFGDVKTSEDLNLPKPPLTVNSRGLREPEVILIPPTAELTAFQQELGRRADNMGSVDRSQDNMLKLATEGRQAASDLRLVDPAIIPTGETKIDRAADIIAETWREHRDDRFIDTGTEELSEVPGALQMVFADMGTPGSDKPWNVYDALRDELVARGMPRESIRFMQDAKNDSEKASLFAACRSGRVSVLIGSTASMGTGVNVQDRLVQQIHMDAPWRPADITQRDGRMLRQGNQNPEVSLIRMVTEGSFDTYMWQTLQRKETFINQIMTADRQHRDVEDLGEGQAEQFGQIKAVASGNPMILREAEANRNLKKLRRLETAHARGQKRLQWRAGILQTEITKEQRVIDDLTPIVDTIRDTTGDAFTMTIGTTTLNERAKAATLLGHTVTPPSRWRSHDFGTIATLGGQPITARWNVSEMQFGIKGSNHLLVTIPADKIANISNTGTITRLENMVRRIPTRIEQAKQDIATKTEQLTQTRALQGAPFPQEARLAAAQNEYDLISALVTTPATTTPTDLGHITVTDPSQPGHPTIHDGDAQDLTTLPDGLYTATDTQHRQWAIHIDNGKTRLGLVQKHELNLKERIERATQHPTHHTTPNRHTPQHAMTRHPDTQRTRHPRTR